MIKRILQLASLSILFSIFQSGWAAMQQPSDVVLVGLFLDKATHTPRIMVSRDQGQTWAVKEVSHLPQGSSELTAVNCIGKGSNTVCAAVGKQILDDKHTVPVIAVSLDGANTWEYKSINNLPPSKHAQLTDVACISHEKAGVMCSAIGTYWTSNHNEKHPLIAVTDHVGEAWQFKTVENITGNWTQLTCVDGGIAHDVCLITGTENVEQAYDKANLLISVDSGNTWQSKLSTGAYYETATLETVTCTGKEASAFCVAAGQKYDHRLTVNAWKPFILESHDSGKTWNDHNVFKDVTYNFKYDFLNASCLMTSSNGYCLLGDHNAYTKDGGVIWNRLDWNIVGTGPVSCVGSEQSSTCVVGGSYSGAQGSFYMQVSHDLGQTWTNFRDPENAYIHPGSVSCTGNGAANATTCIALDNEHAQFVVSNDGGQNWLLHLAPFEAITYHGLKGVHTAVATGG